MPVRALADRVMGAPVVRSMAIAGTSRRLRVLAYHDVGDPDRLDRQLAIVARELVPIGLEDVVDWLAGRRSLPRRAAWVTFDDGDPTVVDVGLPILRRHGIRATMFVCPSVLDTDEPLWWQGVDDDATVQRLKSVPDAERRATIEQLTRPPRRQLTSDQLRAFASEGDVGNHTWDHPMLDRCTPEEQRHQVVAAHEHLTHVLGTSPIAFAYPNGHDTDATARVLDELGYRVAVLHDHRLASTSRPLRTSRLRTSDRHTMDRFSAVIGGVHPLVHGLRTRAARLRTDRRPPRG